MIAYSIASKVCRYQSFFSAKTFPSAPRKNALGNSVSYEIKGGVILLNSTSLMICSFRDWKNKSYLNFLGLFIARTPFKRVNDGCLEALSYPKAVLAPSLSRSHPYE